MVEYNRQTAVKCRIKDVLLGRYVKREGWEPNYLETDNGKIFRVNILGIIISLAENSFMLDDGTGNILIRSFDLNNNFNDKNVGDLVLVIGKPRMYNEEKFIVPEIVKKQDKGWIAYRNKELENYTITPEKEERKVIVNDEPKLDITDSLLKKIEELDNGYGARIDEVLKHFEETTANKIINKLIEQGEIFELKPGVLKIL